MTLSASAPHFHNIQSPISLELKEKYETMRNFPLLRDQFTFAGLYAVSWIKNKRYVFAVLARYRYMYYTFTWSNWRCLGICSYCGCDRYGRQEAAKHCVRERCRSSPFSALSHLQFCNHQHPTPILSDLGLLRNHPQQYFTSEQHVSQYHRPIYPVTYKTEIILLTVSPLDLYICTQTLLHWTCRGLP